MRFFVVFRKGLREVVRLGRFADPDHALMYRTGWNDAMRFVAEWRGMENSQTLIEHSYAEQREVEEEFVLEDHIDERPDADP